MNQTTDANAMTYRVFGLSENALVIKESQDLPVTVDLISSCDQLFYHLQHEMSFMSTLKGWEYSSVPACEIIISNPNSISRVSGFLTFSSDLGIVKKEGVCGGDACIKGTRIPVWTLVQFKKMGADEETLLSMYPTLTHIDLSCAFSYYCLNKHEIDRQIDENEHA